ncbi:hypothetical protein M1D97_10705 [Kushneria sp. AK178]
MDTMSTHRMKVIDLESVRQQRCRRHRIVRMAPELDGLEMLYQLASDPHSLYGMPVLAWGLQEDGQVVGLVPWLDCLTRCSALEDPEQGRFVGYRDPETEFFMDSAPLHKVVELEHAAAYFEYEHDSDPCIIQHLPDTQGTHALCHAHDDSWQLKQVHGWYLYSDGNIEALLQDEEQACDEPILPGDDCLYAGHTRHESLYLFQRPIANRIRSQDPATLEALSVMMVTQDRY